MDYRTCCTWSNRLSLFKNLSNFTRWVHIWPSSSHSFGGKILFKISIISRRESTETAVVWILQAAIPTFASVGSLRTYCLIKNICKQIYRRFIYLSLRVPARLSSQREIVIYVKIENDEWKICRTFSGWVVIKTGLSYLTSVSIAGIVRSLIAVAIYLNRWFT